MTIDELKEKPSIREHFPQVEKALDEYLVSHLLETAMGSEGKAEHAQAEIGAVRAIANVIRTFRSLSDAPAQVKRGPVIPPLKRFDTTPKTES